jgi:uncharacterized protein YkwD
MKKKFLFFMVTLLLMCPLSSVFAAQENEVDKAVVDLSKQGKPDLIVQNQIEISDEQELLYLENEDRIAHGAKALVMEERLNNIARLRAAEVVNHFSHDRPNGSRCFTIFKEQGVNYEAAGENLVRGKQLSPEEALKLWLDSPTHCHNIRLRRYEKTGIAHIQAADSVIYWVQVFIKDKS